MEDKRISYIIPYYVIITGALIGLKLINYLDWSWWFILTPLWLPIIFIFAGGIMAASISTFWAVLGLFMGREIVDAR